MKCFFKNHGPFDINQLLNFTNFTLKQKFKKFKIKNISTLNFAKKGDITFCDNNKYINDLKITKASFCLLKENNLQNLNKNCIPIISKQPLLDFIIITSKFYPDAMTDSYKFKQSPKYKAFNKQGTYIDNSVKIGKKFQIGINSSIKKNVIIGNNVRIGSNCVISNAIIEDDVIINDGTEVL